MAPTARVERAGPAAVVAMTKPTAQNAPVARAVNTRAVSTTAKEALSAATAWPRAKTARAPMRVWRWGRRRVAMAMAMVGPPTIIPAANAVINRPAWDTLTFRSAAISGSSPAMTNSVVPIRNVLAASTQTTKGNFPGADPMAEGMRKLLPVRGGVVLGEVRRRPRW